MRLTAEERSWLGGEAGPALQRAMEIVVALGRIYGAERLIPVESVQISGVSYRNLGEAGLRFLRRWVEEGARVRVPTFLNPTAMDLAAWREQGFDPHFAARQAEIVELFARMGVGAGEPMPTCAPYYLARPPRAGSHVAWAESSAVSYANSLLGARTNREGGPGAIAAALTGRVAEYGLHLEANRRPTVTVAVQEPPRTVADFSALGALVGREIGRGIPYFVDLQVEEPLREAKLKALGAAMAATGAVALYHVAGVTPEAAQFTPPAARLTVGSLREGYAMLDEGGDVDLLWVGCPHASPEEIERVAARVAGRRLRRPLWITCSRAVRRVAVEAGWAERIEAAGGRLYADACLAIAPLRDLGIRAVGTTSAKGAFYLRNLAGVAVRFGTLDDLLDSVVS